MRRGSSAGRPVLWLVVGAGLLAACRASAPPEARRARALEHIPLSEPERRLCSLYVQYASDGHSDDLRRELRHRHLELLMRHRYIDEAAEAAAAFVVDYPNHELAARAAAILVDALALQWVAGSERDEARERLLEWSARLPSMPVWHHPEAGELRRRLEKLHGRRP
jgi:hypothetical protein